MKSISIKTTSQDPIYQQIYTQITTQIINGDIESDSLLPSIRKMAKELRVSIITIKKTWELLEQNDFIYTVAGKGSYVKKSSKKMLDKRKVDIVKQSFKEGIELSSKMGLTQEEVLEIIETLYNK